MFDGSPDRPEQPSGAETLKRVLKECEQHGPYASLPDLEASIHKIAEWARVELRRLGIER